MAQVLSLVVSLVLATTAFASDATVPLQISLSEWQPQVGDQIIFDTKENWGYLVHDDGRYIRFPIVTGQQRNVWYIGRYYHAATPNWNWEVQTSHIKGDRVTFGPSGRFLRMFKDGDTRTAYGIHGHRDAEEMIAHEKRFRSMGCIIVREDMLDLIETTFNLNNQNLSVQTVHGNPFEMVLSKK